MLTEEAVADCGIEPLDADKSIIGTHHRIESGLVRVESCELQNTVRVCNSKRHGGKAFKTRGQ